MEEGKTSHTTVPVSALTTCPQPPSYADEAAKVPTDEYAVADKKFYDKGYCPFFAPGGVVLAYDSLSALAKQSVRERRIAHEMEVSKAVNHLASLPEPQLTAKWATIGDRVIYNESQTGTITKISSCNNGDPSIVQVTLDNRLPGSIASQVIDVSVNFLKPYMDSQLTECHTSNPLEDQVKEDGATRTPARIDFLKDLDLITQQVFDMLSEKNLKYGDSALNPSGIFAKCDPIELINVRIDDKLARIKNGAANEDEDPEWDLIGYLFLKRIAKMRQGRING